MILVALTVEDCSRIVNFIGDGWGEKRRLVRPRPGGDASEERNREEGVEQCFPQQPKCIVSEERIRSDVSATWWAASFAVWAATSW